MSDERDPELDPELSDVARLLDEVAAQEEADLRAAAELRDAPGARLVQPTLARAWGADAQAPRGRRWMVLAGVAAAAAAIIIFVLLRRADPVPRSGPSGLYLGDATCALAYPPEHAQAWDRIEWTGPAAATYRVRVRDARTGATIFGPLQKDHANALQLKPEETATWPEQITIELEQQQKDGSWLAAPPRDSQLRP